jgi:hypothetical protein
MDMSVCNPTPTTCCGCLLMADGEPDEPTARDRLEAELATDQPLITWATARSRRAPPRCAAGCVHPLSEPAG